MGKPESISPRVIVRFTRAKLKPKCAFYVVEYLYRFLRATLKTGMSRLNSNFGTITNKHYGASYD